MFFFYFFKVNVSRAIYLCWLVYIFLIKNIIIFIFELHQKIDDTTQNKLGWIDGLVVALYQQRCSQHVFKFKVTGWNEHDLKKF
jgi:hypothetical protein